MPNWCEGSLKVRGTKENLKKFILNGLKPVNFKGEEQEKLCPNEINNIVSYFDCWIVGTRRGFVENLDIYLDDLDDCEPSIIVLDTKFAWGIFSKELLEICKKFNVDMKIYAFESGNQFNQSIEIVDGKIVQDEEITFDDYGWECLCPKLGG